MVFSCLKNDYLQVKGGLEGFPMMLVGNKCDEEAGGQLVTCFWKWVLSEVGNLSSGLPVGLEPMSGSQTHKRGGNLTNANRCTDPFQKLF